MTIFVQAVVEMQRSIGELCAKTDRLIADVKSQGDKIDSVRQQISWLTGAAVAVAGVIALIFAVWKSFPIVGLTK